jgi:hypothetical protein
MVNNLSCSERSMVIDYSHTKTEGDMATTKSSAKSSSVKPLAPPSRAAPAKVKQTSKVKPLAKPEPIAKGKAKVAPKVGKAKVAGARAKKPPSIPLEQRRHYVEMAAYYIAERRGFAPGNPLEDWVQAEAEIDRLLSEGRLGG